MKISLNWLKQYIDLPKKITPEELALKLTMSTVEVEEVIDLSKNFAGMVVGEIMEILDHPQADRLKVCKVKADKEYQVVCGGNNIYKGLKGILALPGALVKWHGNGELVKLEEVKIRGVESFGMLCAAGEVGLPESFSPEGGVVDLKTGKPGEPVAELLGMADVVLDIDNKSITHRPDLWGHYGIAREIAALYGLKLKEPKLGKFKEGNQVDLKVEIQDKENCSRYMSAVVSGIKIQPSPLWLQNLLKAAGVRPINNIVDITNYVTLELGRPSHAFDRRNIHQDTIIVRRAKNGEKFETLDGQIRTLTDKMCLVCDAEKPVDLAGIMGGLNSEIKEDTTEIILELANFNPVNLRRTSLALGLRTEASARFEKSLDPKLAETGLYRILTLIQELLPESQITSKIIDVNYDNPKEIVINLDLAWLNKEVGSPSQRYGGASQEIPKKTVIKILESLAFKVKDNKKSLSVIVPSFRATKDISIPEDLVEEVSRIYGYDNIQSIMPQVSMEASRDNLELKIERRVKDLLALASGYSEVYNYSFCGDYQISALGLKTESHIKLKNYFSAEQQYLRTSLFESLLNNLESNLRFFEDFKLFEVGRAYNKESGEYQVDSTGKKFLGKQGKIIAGLVMPGTDQAFYEAKGALEAILNELEVNYRYQKPANDFYPFVDLPKSLAIYSNEELLGFIGFLKLTAEASGKIKKPAVIWQLDESVLVRHAADNFKYQPLSKYPGIVYDIALVVKQTVPWAEIRQTVLELNPLIKRVELFDIYNIERLGPDKKSLAFHVYFQDNAKTLLAKEAEVVREQIVGLLTKQFKAEVR